MEKINHIMIPIGAEKAEFIPPKNWFTGKMKDSATIDLGDVYGFTSRTFRYISDDKITETGNSCKCTKPDFMDDEYHEDGQIIVINYDPRKTESLGKIKTTVYLYSNGKKQIIKLVANVKAL